MSDVGGGQHIAIYAGKLSTSDSLELGDRSRVV